MVDPELFARPERGDHGARIVLVVAKGFRVEEADDGGDGGVDGC